MYHPGVGRSGRNSWEAPLQRMLAHVHPYVTLANLVGLLGSIFVLVCLLALPMQISFRLLFFLLITNLLEFPLLLLLGTQYIRTRRQIWILVVIACLAGLSQAFFGYIQAYFNLGPQAFTREGSSLLRVYGTFNQPNPYAGYINITL